MISSLALNNFSAVPYLKDSKLMQNYGYTLHLSTTKPNVIVGPNGAGKSALLTTLAIRHLAFFTPQSCLDNNFLKSPEAEVWWSTSESWRNDYEFMRGLEIEGSIGPARYYRPGHLPGNETSVAASMMTGYLDQAREFDRKTSNRSSGQQCQSLLQDMTDVLTGKTAMNGILHKDFTLNPADLRKKSWVGPWDYKAEVLKRMFADADKNPPIVIMDEPEQSLDALAELELWKTIEAADCKMMQVVVATHSLYPILSPEKFNLIEAVPDYAARVRNLAFSSS